MRPTLGRLIEMQPLVCPWEGIAVVFGLWQRQRQRQREREVKREHTNQFKSFH